MIFYLLLSEAASIGLFSFLQSPQSDICRCQIADLQENLLQNAQEMHRVFYICEGFLCMVRVFSLQMTLYTLLYINAHLGQVDFMKRQVKENLTCSTGDVA